MEEHQIFLIGGEYDEYGTLFIEPSYDLCKLKFHVRDSVYEGQATDFFDAFIEIREKLEGLQLIPFCYGASLNVYPSGMARDMGAGLKAYKLEIGCPAKRDDLVEIFEQGHDVIPSSVSNQREYFQSWLESLNA